MSDAPIPLTPPRHELIDFHGDQLIAVVLEGDGVAIPLRLLCERIGLDTDAQAEKLRTHPVLAAGLRVVNVEMNGRVRSVMAIIHTKIPFWLATISPELVNDETRPKLIQYQTELADILARLFYGAPTTPSPLSADPAIASLQQQFHVALDEMRRVREAIIEEQQEPGYRQTEDNLYQLLFGQFKVDMGIPRYDALPIDKYPTAVAWIEQKATELLPGDPNAMASRQETFL